MAHAQQVQPWWQSGVEVAGVWFQWLGIGTGFLLGMAFCVAIASIITARHANQRRRRSRADSDHDRLSDIARR
jgi:hypothetical protein